MREKSATWTAETADVGPRGCRITLRRQVARGALLELRFDSGDGTEPVETVGQVVWSRATEPPEAGIVFLNAPQAGTGASSWMDALAVGQLRRAVREGAGASSLGTLQDAVLRLGRAPRAALAAGALVVVKVAQREGRVAEVPGGPEALAALAALLGDGTVTLGTSRLDAQGWKRVLSLLPAAAPAPAGKTAAAPAVVVPPPARARALVPPPPARAPARAADARTSQVAKMIADTLLDEDDGPTK